MFMFYICITSLLALPAFSSSKCFVPGECVGQAYTTEELTNVEKCIWNCWKSPICQWSSYDPNKSFCSYYSDFYEHNCDEIDDSNCPQCLTNAKDCQEESKVLQTFIDF